MLVQGCSNKEIGGQLNVKLARYVHEGESAIVTPSEGLTPTEIKISILVWEGLTNREIGKIIGTSEQVVKNRLRTAFDKLGVWTRLELAMYVASHGGKGCLTESEHCGSLGTLERSVPILTPLTFHL